MTPTYSLHGHINLHKDLYNFIMSVDIVYFTLYPQTLESDEVKLPFNILQFSFQKFSI